MRESSWFHIFWSNHMRYFDGSGVYCDVFGVKESEYHVQMPIILVAEGYSWNLEVKSTKKFHFQSYFLLSSHISATDGLWKWFLKITIHMDAYFKEYHILFVTMAYTLDLQDGQSWYMWWKMPSLITIFVTFFLANMPHLNYQQNITECFVNIVNIRGGHAPGHHDLHIRFSKWLLVMVHPSNWKLLEVHQGLFVYFCE